MTRTIFCCLGVAVCAPLLAQTQVPDYNASLKSFLNRGAADCEVVYSDVQHTNAHTINLIEVFTNSRISQASLLAGFEKPAFYRIRVAKEGFFIQKGSDLDSVLRDEIQTKATSVFGLISNRYWQVQPDVKVTDDTKMQEWDKQRVSWKSMLNDKVRNALSLGLVMQLGSLQWNDQDFTAIAPEQSTFIPKDDWGKRCISGTLLSSNGVPSSMRYALGSFRFEAAFEYADPIPGYPRIPNRIHTRRTNTNGLDEQNTITIFRLIETNFPANATSPDEFRTFGGKGSELAIARDGSAAMTRVLGKRLDNPIPVPKNTRAPSNSIGFVARCIFFSSLVMISLFFVTFYLKSRIRPPRNSSSLPGDSLQKD